MPGSLPICVNRPVEAGPIICCKLKSTRLTRHVSNPPGHILPVDGSQSFLDVVQCGACDSVKVVRMVRCVELGWRCGVHPQTAVGAVQPVGSHTVAPG